MRILDKEKEILWHQKKCCLLIDMLCINLEILQESIIKDYDAFNFYLGVQKFVSYCSEDLGGFYLDVIKDRLYTMKEELAWASICTKCVIPHYTVFDQDNGSDFKFYSS